MLLLHRLLLSVSSHMSIVVLLQLALSHVVLVDTQIGSFIVFWIRFILLMVILLSAVSVVQILMPIKICEPSFINII